MGDYKKTKETVNQLCNNIRLGLTKEDATSLSGINKTTFYRWLKEDPEFKLKIDKAEKECKQRLLALVNKAAVETWQAAAWLLERKWANEFGQRPRADLSITNQPGGKVLIVKWGEPKKLPEADSK